MSKKLTTDVFIEKAKVVHGNKYDYSKVVYVNSDSKITILCKEHGEFEQKAANHLQGKGCTQCGINKSTTAKVKTNTQFIEEVTKIHNNKYSYEHAIYTKIEAQLVVTCPIHGEFKIRASNHLQGHGCKACRNETIINKLRTKDRDVLSRFREVHKNKYDYSKVHHVDMTTPVIIICEEHGEFSQIPVAHVSGQGCPSCAKTGFDNNKPAILYYLKITTDNGKVLYKIGITNRTVNESFILTVFFFLVIFYLLFFFFFIYAQCKEKEILKMYKKYKYKGPKILDSGNTELFTEDVLALYYAKVN